MIFLLIVVFILIIIYEAPELIRNKYWKELIAFSFLMVIAFVISLLYILHVKVPNPMKDTQYIVRDIFKNLFHLSYD